jgi:hypothetical protein
MKTLSVFSDMSTGPRWLLNQCERYDPAAEPDAAREGDWRVVHASRDADAFLCVNLPVWPKAIGLMPWWSRVLSKIGGGRTYHAAKVRHTMKWLGTPRDRTYMLMYEPPPIAERYRRSVGRHVARAWAPDGRWAGPALAHDRLPVWWTIGASRAALLAEPIPDDDRQRDLPLVIVTGGKSTLPGHVDRLDFLRLLRRAGVPLTIYGRGVPPDLGSLGPVTDKAEVLRRARLTLAIENWWQGDLYVSEKLWDPLLCWSLPIYFGSRAADAMIPADSFVRLPDLGEAGVGAVRAALADGALWRRRLGAMAAARAAALGRLRMVPWFLSKAGTPRAS